MDTEDNQPKPRSTQLDSTDFTSRKPVVLQPSADTIEEMRGQQLISRPTPVPFPPAELNVPGDSSGDMPQPDPAGKTTTAGNPFSPNPVPSTTPSAGLHAPTIETGPNLRQTELASDTPKLTLLGNIPRGVIIIVSLAMFSGLSLIASALTDHTPGVNSGVAVVSGIVTILLAFWLLTLSSTARTIVLVLSVLGIMSSTLTLFRLADAKNALDTSRANVQQRITVLEQQKYLSVADANTLTALKKDVEMYDASNPGRKFAVAYATTGLQLAYSGFVVVYLLRPSVKDRFGS